MIIFVEKKRWKMEKEFQIRTYGKAELGMLYSPGISPDSARKKLMYWIGLQPRLVEALRLHGLRTGSKTFTPMQVRLIVEAIGEP